MKFTRRSRGWPTRTRFNETNESATRLWRRGCPARIERLNGKGLRPPEAVWAGADPQVSTSVGGACLTAPRSIRRFQLAASRPPPSPTCGEPSPLARVSAHAGHDRWRLHPPGAEGDPPRCRSATTRTSRRLPPPQPAPGKPICPPRAFHANVVRRCDHKAIGKTSTMWWSRR